MKFWKILFNRNKKSQEIQEAPQLEAPVENVPEERWILCIDGGGMRGIIPMEVLKRLEEKIRKAGGKNNIVSYFDLIAGTSTGGLIALALTCPSTITTKDVADGHQVSLDAIEDIYLTRGQEIFTQGPVEKLLITRIAMNKYNKEGIETFLDELFGHVKMGQAIKPTLACTYDLSTGTHFGISSFETPDIPVKTGARCTSAAPTYFAPVKYRDKLLVDGGVIANNPAIYAYAAARELYPNCQKFHFVSLSTGAGSLTMEESETQGLITWIDKVVPMFSTAQKSCCDFVLESVSDVDYIRIDKQLKKNIKMDNINPAALEELRLAGIETADQYDSLLEETAKKLVEHAN